MSNMRVYMLICILSVCSCAPVVDHRNPHLPTNIPRSTDWQWQDTNLELEQAMAGDLNGKDICDDEIFPPKDRKSLCEMTFHVNQASADVFKCEVKMVLFFHARSKPIERSMFGCLVGTDQYYFGRGRNDNEIAVYTLPNLTNDLDPEDQDKIRGLLGDKTFDMNQYHQGTKQPKNSAESINELATKDRDQVHGLRDETSGTNQDQHSTSEEENDDSKSEEYNDFHKAFHMFLFGNVSFLGVIKDVNLERLVKMSDYTLNFK